MASNHREWDEKVITAKGSFLQSWSWGVFQEKLGRAVFHISDQFLIASIICYPLPFRKNYFYIPHGPLFLGNNIKKSIQSFLQDIRHIAIKNPQCIFLRIDPRLPENNETKKAFETNGFKKVLSSQPQSTILIDLLKSEEDLLRDMEHDTRYAIRTAVKRGVVVQLYSSVGEKREKFDVFWNLFQETNNRNQLKMYPRKYYENLLELEGECRTELFLGEHEGTIVAGALIVYFGTYTAYLHAASKKGTGKLNAPTLILWNAICHAKEKGCLVFDLWGISDELSKWKGITAFKRSFGGKEIRYIGTWDYAFSPLWYFMYNIVKRIKRLA